LFLDEPTTGLDPISRNKVWTEVKRLNQELGMTIFLTTQYLEEADQLADRVGIINRGKLVAEGTPTELKKSLGSDVIIAVVQKTDPTIKPLLEALPGITKVDVLENKFLISSDSGSTMVGKVALALEKSKINLESLTLRTTTLDDVFLAVTGDDFDKQAN
jgi:ABC-2 type transport system ATP-binding protein